MARPAFRILTAAALAATPLVLSGCAGGNESEALRMPKTQVAQVLYANLDTVDGTEPHRTDYRPALSEWGCDTAFPSALPQGPPWRYTVTRRHDDVPSSQVEQWRAAALDLVTRGFTERTLSNSTGDRRDVVMRDDRGFQVDMTVSPAPRTGTAHVELRSSSPCIQPPENP